MPCYDSVKIDTLTSVLQVFSTLGKNGVHAEFRSVKSSLVTHARNLLTCAFLNSDCDYMLFVDSDIEFQPDAVLRMLVPEKDIICTPYRVKEDPLKMKYAVTFSDPNNIHILPWDLVEIDQGPAGLMLIHRRVFEKLIETAPDLKINFEENVRKLMNKEIASDIDAVDKYMYNFWDTSFHLDTGEWKGEDLSFCSLAKEAGFKIYANLDSTTVHHGNWGFKGKFGDSLMKRNNEGKNI